MATMNGILPTHQPDSSFDPSSNIRKRKRSGSEDVTDIDLHMLQNKAAHLQNSMQATLDMMRNYDTTPSLIRYPQPLQATDGPEAKRTRLATPIQETLTIEERVLGGRYDSYDDMLQDFESAAVAIEEGNRSQMNGESSYLSTKTKERLFIMRRILEKVVRLQTGVVKEKAAEVANAETVSLADHDSRDGGQVLTLRTQTDKGPRQLFSGLQRAARLETLASGGESIAFDIATPIDLKKLPNGFDLAEAAPLEAHTRRKGSKAVRTIGEVFKPHRNVKSLEAPSVKSGAQGRTLHFVSDFDAQFAQRAVPIYKTDYAYASLPTGQWLRYKDSDSGSQLSAASRRRRQERTFSLGDSTTRPVVDDQLASDQAKTNGLFQAAYSSFAPSYDDSSAVISERTRNDLWWQKGGQERFQSLFSIQYPEDEQETTSNNNVAKDNFSDLVVNFEPDTDSVESFSGAVGDENNMKDVEDLLEEVSGLLQTLSSYQRTRDLATSKSGSVPTPSNAEFDTYEILKSQLALLVKSLPPFAVAKLNGEQLQELNISTTLISSGNDYPGTGEDELALHRKKLALAASAAAGRASATMQPASRPSSYQTPTAGYTPRPQAYTATQAYGRATPAQPFQTPRPPSSTASRPSYPQAQYGSSMTPGYAQQSTSLQQFQRPMPNGYPTYGAGTPQTNRLQSPTQPGYQQRAQENVVNNYGQSGSPQKPMMNGQHSQQGMSRPSLGQQQYAASLAAMQQQTDAQRASMERLKAQNQQTQTLQQLQAENMRQRQGSGTPLPQTPVSGRYDGADERKSSATPTTAEVKGQAESAA